MIWDVAFEFDGKTLNNEVLRVSLEGQENIQPFIPLYQNAVECSMLIGQKVLPLF